MSLKDGFVALGVLGAFGWIILIQMAKKKPAIKEFMKSLSPISQKVEGTPESFITQQVHTEKRAMI